MQCLYGNYETTLNKANYKADGCKLSDSIGKITKWNLLLIYIDIRSFAFFSDGAATKPLSSIDKTKYPLMSGTLGRKCSKKPGPQV